MSAHTPGPWSVWEGPLFVGGGADICIGAGEEWLANMNHRRPRCPQIFEDGHDDNDSCDICMIDSGHITEEQRANAHLIAAAPDMLAILKTTAENIRSLGPAGALAQTFRPYEVWLAEVDAVIAKAEGRSA